MLVGRLVGWTHFSASEIFKFRFNNHLFYIGVFGVERNDGQVPHGTCPSDATYYLTLYILITKPSLERHMHRHSERSIVLLFGSDGATLEVDAHELLQYVVVENNG